MKTPAKSISEVVDSLNINALASCTFLAAQMTVEIWEKWFSEFGQEKFSNEIDPKVVQRTLAYIESTEPQTQVFTDLIVELASVTALLDSKEKEVPEWLIMAYHSTFNLFKAVSSRNPQRDAFNASIQQSLAALRSHSLEKSQDDKIDLYITQWWKKCCSRIPNLQDVCEGPAEIL